MVDVKLVVEIDGKPVKKLDMERREGDNAFSTGSIGYYVRDTIDIDGKSHNLNCPIVQAGSKPKTPPKQ
jgi:hypothetical protein